MDVVVGALSIHLTLLYLIKRDLDPNPFRKPITCEVQYRQQVAAFAEDVCTDVVRYRPPWIAIGPHILPSIGAERQQDMLRRVNRTAQEHGFRVWLGKNDGEQSFRIEYLEDR